MDIAIPSITLQETLFRKAPASLNVLVQAERRTRLGHCDRGMMLARPRIGERLTPWSLA